MSNQHNKLVDIFDTALMVEDIPNARYIAQLAAEVIKNNPDTVLKYLGGGRGTRWQGSTLPGVAILFV